MKKRIITLLMAAMLVLSLSGCGNATQGSGSQGSQSTPSVSDNKETSSTTGSTATADFLKTITAETAEAKGVCGADLTWYYKENVLVIKGTGDMTDFGANKAPWQDIKDNIAWVIVDDGITSIGTYAFFNYSSISKISIGKDVSFIGDGAISGCYSLKELTLPASVKEMGGGAFEFNELETLTFIGDAPEGLHFSIAGGHDTLTINYSGTGFEPYIEEYPNINWVKQ